MRKVGTRGWEAERGRERHAWSVAGQPVSVLNLRRVGTERGDVFPASRAYAMQPHHTHSSQLPSPRQWERGGEAEVRATLCPRLRARAWGQPHAPQPLPGSGRGPGWGTEPSGRRSQARRCGSASIVVSHAAPPPGCPRQLGAVRGRSTTAILRLRRGTACRTNPSH